MRLGSSVGAAAVAIATLLVLASSLLAPARAVRVSAADILSAHYPAALQPDGDSDEVGAEGAEEADASRAHMRGMVPPPPMPPPPPPPPNSESVLLQLEQKLQRSVNARLAAEKQRRVQELARLRGLHRQPAAAEHAEDEDEDESESEDEDDGLSTAELELMADSHHRTAQQHLQRQKHAHAHAHAAGQKLQQQHAARHAAALGHAAAQAASHRHAHRHRAKEAEPFPEQSFTYKDESSPPDWLVPQKSEPAGPTTKPPPVPQMIPPPPPVPFPTYNYQDPNAAGPFSQFAPGVQGWGYDGGYAGPYDGFSLYGHYPNQAQVHGHEHAEIPRTAAQIAAATAASQYHPYGAPPPLYSLGTPPPDGAASWVPVGAFLKPGTMEGNAGNE